MGKLNSYQDLIVWQKAMQLVTDIYSLTRLFPSEEKFGIVSQINRSAVSVPANIAEGWGRESSKNYLQFLRTSRGSLMELETLLIISKNLNYITVETSEEIQSKLREVSKLLQGLIKSINQKISLVEATIP